MRSSTTGTGIMALGIVLAAVGAVLIFAVTAQARGFDIHEVGVVFLAVGGVTVSLSVLLLASSSYRRTTIREQVEHGTDQDVRVLRREDLAP